MGNSFKKLISEGLAEDGYLSHKLMELDKSISPVFCVDAVLVPESDKPQAILFYRDKTNFASPKTYWIVGGRVQKGQTMIKAIQDKIKKETDLNLIVKKEDQLFTEDLIHIKKEDGKFYVIDYLPKGVKQKDVYHTPATCYLVRTPPFEEIKDLIRPGNKNDSFKVIKEISPSLNPYIQKAISLAWKKCGFNS